MPLIPCLLPAQAGRRQGEGNGMTVFKIKQNPALREGRGYISISNFNTWLTFHRSHHKSFSQNNFSAILLNYFQTASRLAILHQEKN